MVTGRGSSSPTAPGATIFLWWQQVPYFARRFRCVVYDQPGWGESTCEGGPNPTRFARDLCTLLDHLGADRVALVGQSMSGWAVLGSALAAPSRVTHVLLASTLAGLVDDATAALLLRAIDVDAERPLDGRVALAADFPERDPTRTFLFERITAMNPPLGAPFLRALVALRLSLPAVSPPFATAFVAGDRDRLFPLPLVQLAHARMPEAQLTVVPGAGHSVYFEHPEAFNHALDALLAR
ncbi:MAG: alpha/beta fold hydrolase [Deltaproteobacteria bacterium]|nr:alpha/beta fold hydrolase [Deltaproteobacteria bacterium]